MKTFEDFLKEEIRVDKLTPIQYSGIMRAHAKYVKSCSEPKPDWKKIGKDALDVTNKKK